MFGNKQEKSEKHHVQRWVIGLGFLSGLWIALGIHPKEYIWNYISLISKNLPLWIQIAILAIPTIFTVITMIRIVHKGGGAGMLAVSIAYIGGLVILIKPTIGLILTIAAVIIGMLTFK